MKRIVRGVCGLLSAVMLLSTTAMAAERYEPVTASDARVEGFYNGDNTSLQMELVGRYNSGAMSKDGGSLEIVQYNARNGFAYAVSGVKGVLIAIDLKENMSGSTVADLTATGKEYDLRGIVKAEDFTYGDMTSVAVSPDGSKLAVAIQAKDYDKAGVVAVFTCKNNGALSLIKTVPVGVQPDMLTFADHNTILTADEGEPCKGKDATDPKGSVTIVTISPDTAEMTANSVYFDKFDKQRDALTTAGILIQKDPDPSTDFEPEYIAVNGRTAYVALQEANAIAVLDLDKAEFTGVYPLGLQDYSQTKVDLQKDKKIDLTNYENVYGIKMPDGISVTTVGGKTYLLTANEGDSRSDWAGLDNEVESKDSPTGNVKLDEDVVWFNAKLWDGLDTGKAYIFGGRSFSLYEVTDAGLTLVYDSGSDFEEITAKQLPDYFNCSNDKTSMDNRSGKKGPEPESVTVGTVGSKTYAFIALERIGGVMVYDITDPNHTKFVNYINSRDFTDKIKGDVSPEGLCFIPEAESSTGKPLLLAACEVSGTLAVYELTGEQSDPGIDPILAAILAAVNQQRFEDVASNAYCYDAVNWAVEQKITSGTGKYTFSPDAACTRADFVTFLWRAAGKPVVNFAMNFSDVKEGAYYAEAVRWAASLGIVTGLNQTTFGASNAVTREQAVTMLWRFAKQQGFDTTQGGMAIREYEDYDSLSEYAREAMAWAVNAGILKGSGNRLLPDASCTRAQLVTLLYRLLK